MMNNIKKNFSEKKFCFDDTLQLSWYRLFTVWIKFSLLVARTMLFFQIAKQILFSLDIAKIVFVRDVSCHFFSYYVVYRFVAKCYLLFIDKADTFIVLYHNNPIDGSIKECI